MNHAIMHFNHSQFQNIIPNTKFVLEQTYP